MSIFKTALRGYSTTQGLIPTTIKSLYKQISNPPQTVDQINGWVKSVRLLKKVGFIDLQDGSCLNALKVVVPITQLEETEFLKSLKTGQSVSVTGALWNNTPQREQPFELKIADPLNTLSVTGDVSNSYPLQKKAHSIPFLRSLPTLKHRTTYLGSLLRFRSAIEHAISETLESDQFIKVAPPILTSSDCEGAGELFKVASTSGDGYFGKPTFLTVSAQLHLEIMALALSRCYSLIPCFRAEKSDTNRHLSEFWMLELEMCFIDDVHKLTTYVESMLRRVVKSCYDRIDELIPQVDFRDSLSKEEIIERWNLLLSPKPWATITYTDAIEILIEKHKKEPFPKYEPIWGESLQTEHEKWLADKYFNSPVFVTDYPRDCKAFYMKLNTDSPAGRETVACFDLLFPDMGEVVGGSIREDSYQLIFDEVERRNMNRSGELDWYLSLRKEGTVSHGGFGLGLERFVSYLYGNHNIRDAIPFHRSASGNINL